MRLLEDAHAENAVDSKDGAGKGCISDDEVEDWMSAFKKRVTCVDEFTADKLVLNVWLLCQLRVFSVWNEDMRTYLSWDLRATEAVALLEAVTEI
jgi:hypothetical protein